MRTLPRAVAAVASAALLLVVAGCSGSSSSDDAVASDGGSSSPQGASRAPAVEQVLYDKSARVCLNPLGALQVAVTAVLGVDGKVVANVKLKPWYPPNILVSDDVQALDPVALTLTADAPTLGSVNNLLDAYPFTYGASYVSGTFTPPAPGKHGYVRFRGTLGSPAKPGGTCLWNFGPFDLPS